MKPCAFSALLDWLGGAVLRYDLARDYAMPLAVDDMPEYVIDGVLYWQALLSEYCAAVAGWPDGTHRIPFTDWKQEVR